MSDQKDSSTTTLQWQDNHSRMRRHKLITKRLAKTIPAIGATANASETDELIAQVKLFCPYSDRDWYIIEMDPETGLCFGLVEGRATEIGYFELTELAESMIRNNVPAIERELHWKPATLREITGGLSKDPSQSQAISADKTMTEAAEVQNPPRP